MDVRQLVSAIWSKMWLIGLAAVVCGFLAFLGTYYFVTPRYEASTVFYVNNSTVDLGDAGISIDSGDLSAAKSLVDSYIVILESRETLEQVAAYTGVDKTYEELKVMISAASVNATEIFEVVVTGPHRYETDRIADAIGYILPSRISEIIEGTSAKVVDMAVVPTSPSYPSYGLNILIGIFIGVLVSVGGIVAWSILDVTVREEADIAHSCHYPILASVPDLAAPSKGSYYSYGGMAREVLSPSKTKAPVGSGISFAGAEAYKLLRTKLQFSFSDDGGCHVIGVTSALAGEGKSLSAVNLAYTLSQLEKRVLLIDCDMRRPSVAAKLRIRKAPGLSNYLTGQSEPKALLQKCGIPGEEEAFQVIAAGRNPPNPVELLSSQRMGAFLRELRGEFDYILLDLPPVGEVSDALAVARWVDGTLLVVRQNYCSRNALHSAARQLAFVEGRVLGIVCNCAVESTGSYKKYYKHRQRGYRGSYASGRKSGKKS